ncbi:hypothetical protein J41TS2_14840 [Bacillus sonorensis]|uniref:Uncharacterized protein n=1 Tax=Bacillus sonorensis L12 TaxID=1274524 RepID=M5P3U4_9BACI|nr:hypothetical protein BSONL12_13036 [Bacillus sonorensis L12]GIN66063.1 hypothetical protein J41TS2_14840 [Bacillus sonorensis]
MRKKPRNNLHAIDAVLNQKQDNKLKNRGKENEKVLQTIPFWICDILYIRRGGRGIARREI